MPYPDLNSQVEIERLVRSFYARVAQDDLLGPVFLDQAGVDWDEHIPKLTAFWCKLELGLAGFTGAPTQRHSELARAIPFRAEQFGRWVALFHDTIDAGWAGPHSDSIKARSVLIAERQSAIVDGAEAWRGPVPTLPAETRRPA